jgi:aerobic-type carbon monoxide dehydrogenase small subunit (CoxS/CutS family)
MIMAAEAKRREGASGGEIANEVHNLCVCGTYQRIRKALGTVK